MFPTIRVITITITYPVSDAERVLRIIESLAEHVPDHIKVELDSLKGLLKSPLFYQYLDYQDLQKISDLTDSVRFRYLLLSLFC